MSLKPLRALRVTLICAAVSGAATIAYADVKDYEFQLAEPNRRGELVVEDDGVGRGDDVSAKGTGLGTKIVNSMARSMGAEIQYLRRQPGTAARLVFPVPG